MKQLLFEIGTEEIPASYIRPALAFMEQAAQEKFRELGLSFGWVRTAGTPRRLTLAVDDLQDRQQNRLQEYVGPARQVAYDQNGQPTKAALGFARSRGVAVQDLQTVSTPKGEYLMAVEEIKGQASEELLPALLADLVRSIPFPKSMRWANSKMTFARPVQWLLALYDGKVVSVSIEDLRAGSTTRGHRFMSPDEVHVENFEDYLEQLAKKSVIADLHQRRDMVIKEVSKAFLEEAGEEAVPLLDEGLVEIVVNLVERPHGICGSFDEKFLAVPPEVLITSMREHQKYFPATDRSGRLLPFFVAVNNTDVQDRSLAVSGHQRVLRARLEDALFFFSEDVKKPLASRMDGLAGIIFQQKLGTMAEKSDRIASLTAFLADRLAPELKEDALRAARLAKVDLLTAMVGEFPSLQGIIGRAYALRDGEKSAVADAIREHYLPVRAGGELPNSLIGAMVGLADRMDTIIGCFAIGERPTGSKDAFGQRRLALGMINIVRSLGLHLSLHELAEKALAGYAGKIEAKADTLMETLDFVRLRLENDLTAEGMGQDAVDAATSVQFDDIVDCIARIKALEDMRERKEFAVLAGSFKRIVNIVKDNRETGVSPAILTEAAEKDLFAACTVVEEQMQPLLIRQEYCRALAVMLTMKEPLDRFFDQVMVMDEDLIVRGNRLNLLSKLAALVRQVGDISRMSVEQG